MKKKTEHWLRRMVARLLLVTMMISAAGLTFGREILEDGPTGPASVSATASAAQADNQSHEGNPGAKPCDHSCHNTCHFLGQLPADAAAITPEPARQYMPRLRQLIARDHAENPFRPPRLSS